DIDQVFNDIAHTVHDSDGVGVAALFQYGSIDRSLPIHAHHARLDLAVIFRIAHIRNANNAAACDLEWQLIDLLNRRKLAVRVYVVVQRPYRHIAGGQYQIRAVDGPHDVHQAERSEEHTSELQSRFDLVCRLLLEKKKN